MKLIHVKIEVDADAPVEVPPPEVAAGIVESYRAFTVPQLLWLLRTLTRELKARGLSTN